MTHDQQQLIPKLNKHTEGSIEFKHLPSINMRNIGVGQQTGMPTIAIRENNEGTLYHINGTEDHLHPLMELHPITALSD